jgi:hypothetical protein
MAATQESTSSRAIALDALNDAANAKHAIEATAGELATAINALGDFKIIGMYEAMCFSIQALDDAVGRAMEHVGNLAEATPAQ